MALSCLILSRDSQEVSVFECILGSLRIEPLLEGDLSLARIRLRKSKIDGMIVDCDLAGAKKFLRDVRPAGEEPGPVLIVSGSEERSRLEETGAEFVAPKPVSLEQAVHTLSGARNLMLQGQLHYFRQELNAPISITRTQERLKASLLNLSQTGVRVRLEQPQTLHGNVGVHFMLPGTQQALDARGEVAWADTKGNVGIRLVSLTEPAKRDLRLWLEQQYFQSSGN